MGYRAPILVEQLRKKEPLAAIDASDTIDATVIHAQA